MYRLLRSVSEVVDRTVVRIVFAVFFTVSVVCIVGGIALGLKKVAMMFKASRATGVVIAHHFDRAPDIRPLAQPVFVFTNDVGASHTVTQRTTSVFHDFPIGSAVPIIYRTHLPQGAEIRSLSLIFFGPLALVIMGLFGTVTIVLWRFLIRRGRRWVTSKVVP